MRIARVFTVCVHFAVLISAFLGAETVHSARRPRSKDLVAKHESSLDVSEITFTTLHPEVHSASEKPPSNVYLGAHRKYLRDRHRTSSRLRASNLFNGIRRRRQLLKNGGNVPRPGRSLDIGENNIEHHQIDTIQKPEAFQKGAIHIEPIYRVLKNKNLFDSIVNTVQRIFEPEKTQLGPLVGPFNFPGVGDKVYIRLLESVHPNDLVVRLVSHLPATEIETTLQHDVLPSGGPISHAGIPPISHEPLILSPDALLGSSSGHLNVPSSSIAHDSLQSFSNSVVHVSKPATLLNQALLSSSLGKETQTASQLPENILQPAIPARKRNQRLALPVTKNVQKQRNLNQVPRYGQTNIVPESLDRGRYSSLYQGNVYSSANESSMENPSRFTIHDLVRPVNLSSVEKSVPSESFVPYSPNSKEYQLRMNSTERGKDGTRYGVTYTRKKMRYLNLDGTIDTSGDGDRFKPVETNPVLPRSLTSGQYWEPIKGSSFRTKESVKKDQNVQDRSDTNSFLDDRRYLEAADEGGTAKELENQASRCTTRCKANENGSDRYEEDSTTVPEARGDESSVNNSTRLGTTTTKPELDSTTLKPTLHAPQSFKRDKH